MRVTCVIRRVPVVAQRLSNAYAGPSASPLSVGRIQLNDVGPKVKRLGQPVGGLGSVARCELLLVWQYSSLAGSL
jgi:hypothetical protein